ncbi:MAG: hypothetical protein ACOYNC_17460 [Bacteroidales bacterium]
MKRILENRSVRREAFHDAWEGPFDITIQEQGTTKRFARSRNSAEMEEFNEQIKAWSEKVKSALGPSIRSNSISGSKLSRSIRSTYKYEYGEIYRLGFSFARHGIFIHKGVGRGYGMQGGTVVKTSKSVGFNRRPKPWFNPVIDAFIPELGAIIKAYSDTAIVNSTKIFIR